MNDSSQYGSPRARLEWGRRGALAAVGRGDVLVVVDVLRFSTTVATAVAHGAVIYPCLTEEEVPETSARLGAIPAVRHGKGFSLSPLSFLDVREGTRVALWSLNGAICARSAETLEYVFAGALVNAKAVGNTAMAAALQNDSGVTVLAAGERWQESTEEGVLRFAEEDYLGAGAILSTITIPKSAEAAICEGAFQHSREYLPELLRDCESGRELWERGDGADVSHASGLDLYDVAPVLRDGAFQRFRHDEGENS
jgi:2-phosphosulfolactate phosphatase